jgi:hypothetical protein
MWNISRDDNKFGDPVHVANVLNTWASSLNSTIDQRVAWVPVHAWSTFAAPPDAQVIATNGQLGGYSAALYSSSKLQSNIKLVTLDDLANLL